MNQIIALSVVVALAAPAAAQPDPVDILDRMEALRQQRIADVQNYTYIEKSSLADVPAYIQYYERATDADGNPVAAFRMVPPDELANREAVARGEATAQQRAEGLQDALPHVLGAIGSIAQDAGIDVPAEAYGAAMGAHMVLGDIAAGPDMDTNADALEGLEHIETLRENATSAIPLRVDGRAAYLIEANNLADVEGIEFAFDLPEGVKAITVQRIALTIDQETLVPLNLRIEAQGETEDGQTFPVRIEREDWRYQQFSDLYESTCTRGRLAFGDREQTAVMMRRYVELNQGPPSSRAQKQLIADAMDDFENYNCN